MYLKSKELQIKKHFDNTNCITAIFTASVILQKRWVHMDNMNCFELETFLKMVLEILNGCKNISEAKDKIKALLDR